jgi:hypothetical protein
MIGRMLVGQHEAVEAGRPLAQLQNAGLKTVKLEEIALQKDPELKQVVEQLTRGEMPEAIQESRPAYHFTKWMKLR